MNVTDTDRCPACGDGALPAGLRLASPAEAAYGATAVIFDDDMAEVAVAPCVMCPPGRALLGQAVVAATIPVTDSALDAPDGAIVSFDDDIVRQRHGDEWVPLSFAA